MNVQVCDNNIERSDDLRDQNLLLLQNLYKIEQSGTTVSTLSGILNEEL